MTGDTLKHWEAPALGRIHLRADEVLNVNCKLSETEGYGYAPPSCVYAGCAGPGS